MIFFFGKQSRYAHFCSPARYTSVDMGMTFCPTPQSPLDAELST